MRLVIIGAGGQLGQDLRLALGQHDVVPLGHEQVEVGDAAQVQRVIAAARPDVVINTAAYVQVDACEQEIATSFAVNAAGAGHVARASAACGATLVQVSTDYVYGGQAQRQPLTVSKPSMTWKIWCQ